MERHLDELILYIPDLINRKILDLGSGRGKFVIAAALRGATVFGLEPFEEYVQFSQKKIRENNLKNIILKGEGENIPFSDSEFGFVNMGEVIEHTYEPKRVMREVNRVLNVGGKVYISTPNRFGIKDQHFNLYFVNWLPRSFANLFISIFGKHKNYEFTPGLQKLNEMHYYTFNQAKKDFEEAGFEVKDIRLLKIETKYRGIKKILVKVLYLILRPWYFDSFHLLLSKNR